MRVSVFYIENANIMSKDFESLPIEKLAAYVDGNIVIESECDIVKSIVDEGDLWTLAKMSLDYDEEM